MKIKPAINLIEPGWDAPASIRALCTTRLGGLSQAPFDAFNLGAHVGDVAAAVVGNRSILRQALQLPAEPCWLEQTHSTTVVTLEQSSQRQADAAITRSVNTVAAIMTADCLPLLLCNRSGDEVAAVHAGWRGLADGVVQATVAQMNSSPDQLQAWIGPAISRRHFEVGDEVRSAFIGNHPFAISHFVPGRPQHWLCDLPGVAVDMLTRLGVRRVYNSDHCSFGEESLFFSYRRNGVTGRMASLIWIEPGA